MEFRKKLQTRLRTAIAYMIIGLTLMIVGYLTKTDNHFISAFGIGLIANSVLRLRQYRSITKNDSTIRRQETAEKDERNLMLVEKARSWAFGIYIWLTGAVLIILALLGIQDTLVLMISYSICLLMILYWISYHILKRKY